MSFRRAAFLVAISALIILLIGVLNSLLVEKSLFAVDYSEYWVAAKLLLGGENPYLSQSILDVLKSVNWPLDLPIKMYNPPWTLGFVLPLGLTPYSTGRLLWFFIGFIAIILSMNALWNVYDLPHSKKWQGWLLGLCFIPTLQALDVGQLSPLILLGVAGFLFFIGSGRWVLAGICTFLISFKPQLLYLFWPLLILWALHEKHWKVILGCIAAGITFLFIPLIFNPQVLNQYVSEYLGNPPFFFKTPLISFTLRSQLSPDKYWLQFIPSAIGLIWGIAYWFRNRVEWHWDEQMPLIVLVSFLTSSYAWNHDQIVFVPMIVQVFSWFKSNQHRTTIILATYVVIDVGMLLSIWAGQTQDETIWQPFAWAGFYVLARIMKASDRLSAQLPGQVDS